MTDPYGNQSQSQGTFDATGTNKPKLADKVIGNAEKIMGKMMINPHEVVEGDLKAKGIHPDQLNQSNSHTNIGGGAIGEHQSHLAGTQHPNPIGTTTGSHIPGFGQHDHTTTGHQHQHHQHDVTGNTGIAGNNSGTTGYGGTAGASDGQPLGGITAYHLGHSHAGGNVGSDSPGAGYSNTGAAIGGGIGPDGNTNTVPVVEQHVHHHHHLGGSHGAGAGGVGQPGP